jgi:hypothetical protein
MQLLLMLFILLLNTNHSFSKKGESTMINTQISSYLEQSKDFSKISDERKVKLDELTSYIKGKLKNNEAINLNFICTHNSRRSHLSQIWAAVAAEYFGIPNVKTFSGGTETTAFNIRAVNALKRCGFDITIEKEDTNPVYKVSYGNSAGTITAFSKVYDDKFNPSENFAAVMVCSEADEACPYVPGVDVRISLPFEDPKLFDGTDLEAQKYDERSHQISIEMMYVFSKVM